MTNVVVGPVLVLFGVLVLGGCATGAVDKSEVEAETKSRISEQLGGDPVDDVSCPDDLEAEVDQTMVCVATVDGEERDVKLTVTDVGDSRMEWQVDLDEGGKK